MARKEELHREACAFAHTRMHTNTHTHTHLSAGSSQPELPVASRGERGRWQHRHREMVGFVVCFFKFLSSGLKEKPDF